MNSIPSSVTGQETGRSADVRQPASRKVRHAWTEAPHGHDVFLGRFSVVAIVIMVVIMAAVFISRLFGA